MAVNDFTGQNIQDTYQKVVQTDGTNLADGTGSLLPISFEGNDVIVQGALKAESYIVSESIINVSSGSTVFGNSSDDTHTFTGNIAASGNISASGYITSKYIRMSGPEGAGTHRFIVAPSFQETDDDAILLGGNVRIAQKQAQIAAGITPGAGTNVGNLSVLGHVSASELQSNTWVIPEAGNRPYLSYDTSTDYLELGGAAQVGAYITKGIKFYTSGSSVNGFGSIFFGGDTGYIEADGYVSGSSLISETHITASGDISASGNLYGDDLIAIGELFTTGTGVNKIEGILTLGSANVPQGGNNLLVTGTSTFTSHITASGNISSSGNITGLQIFSAGRIFSNNRVGIYNTDSTNFVANDTHQTVISGTNITLNAPVTASIISASLVQTPIITGDTTEATGLEVEGYISATHITASGHISASGDLFVRNINGTINGGTF